MDEAAEGLVSGRSRGERPANPSLCFSARSPLATTCTALTSPPQSCQDQCDQLERLRKRGEPGLGPPEAFFRPSKVRRPQSLPAAARRTAGARTHPFRRFRSSRPPPAAAPPCPHSPAAHRRPLQRERRRGPAPAGQEGPPLARPHRPLGQRGALLRRRPQDRRGRGHPALHHVGHRAGQLHHEGALPLPRVPGALPLNLRLSPPKPFPPRRRPPHPPPRPDGRRGLPCALRSPNAAGRGDEDALLPGERGADPRV